MNLIVQRALNCLKNNLYAKMKMLTYFLTLKSKLVIIVDTSNIYIVLPLQLWLIKCKK